MTVPTVLIVTGNPQPTYISYDDADTYFKNRLGASVWFQANEADRKKSIIMATKKIETLRFKGFKCEQDQDLQFPRYLHPNYLSKHTQTDKVNQININGQWLIFIDISTELEAACCEEAIALLEFVNSAHLKNQQLGISSIDIGIGSVSYKANDSELLSMTALKFLDKFIQKNGKVV